MTPAYKIRQTDRQESQRREDAKFSTHKFSAAGILIFNFTTKNTKGTKKSRRYKNLRDLRALRGPKYFKSAARGFVKKASRLGDSNAGI